MPLRIISYDGANYRNQINQLDAEIKSAKKENRIPKKIVFYPVITLVLYFGERHWSQHKKLIECIEVPKRLKPFVNDYKINVIELRYLSREQVNKFKSDFKIVADYFYQIHNNKDYECPPEQIIHVNEVLDTLKAFTSDERFENLIAANSSKPEGKMEQWLTDRIEKGQKEKSIEIAMNGLQKGLSSELIAEITKIPLEEIYAIAEKNNIKIPIETK